MTARSAMVRFDFAGRRTACKSRNSPGLRRQSVPTAIASIVLAVLPCVAGGDSVFFVDGDAPIHPNDGNDGATWMTAFRAVQDALAAVADVPGDVEIRVAQRTYKPVGSLDNDRTKTFALRSNLTLIGGYSGYGQGS